MASEPNAPEAVPSESTGRGFSRLSRFRRPLVAAIVLGGILSGCNAVTGRLSERWAEGAPRDPETGILIGAETLDLGPEYSDTAVLFVHGFIGGSNNFWELPQRMADSGVRVRALRLPGHGTSPEDFAETPSGEFVPAVLREIRALKEKHAKVVVVGHSMGGALSTLSVSLEDVDGLVLGAPYYGITYQWYYVFPAEFWSGVTRPLVHQVYRTDSFTRVNRVEARREILAYRWIPAAGTKTLITIGKRARDPFVLEQITCPVLMLHSKDDFAASPKQAERAFDLIASEDKRLVWLDDTDHQIFWDYDRERVADEVLQFVAAIRDAD